jgi:hypothetical protein
MIFTAVCMATLANALPLKTPFSLRYKAISLYRVNQQRRLPTPAFNRALRRGAIALPLKVVAKYYHISANVHLRQ